jgi:hypothetical protein
MMHIIDDLEHQNEYWKNSKFTSIYPYWSGNSSSVLNVLPSQLISLSARTTFSILERKYGHSQFWEAMNPEFNFPSPVIDQKNPNWIKNSNIVGINVRTIGNFWNIIKYCMTLGNSFDAIHLLPIWEPGVVSSLYGTCSWNINPEFFSYELQQEVPQLNTPEKQMKAVINILHLMGKTVGMDVIPHTDRYAEQVIANPKYFEWLKRKDFTILQHNNDLYLEVEKLIFDYLKKEKKGGLPSNQKVFFSDKTSEGKRIEILFGNKWDYQERLERREIFVQLLYDHHLETVPATMGPPYRNIEVDTDPSAQTIDERGRIWKDYKIKNGGKFSRVFGPLARYKLYENKDNNKNWEIDFDKPLKEVWSYVASHYQAIQTYFGFDFMRGDMAHVQARSSGVPTKIEDFYDILSHIKDKINISTPYFAYYAETFLVPDNSMTYGVEADHLDAVKAEVTLGDLQSSMVSSSHFHSEFYRYRTLMQSHQFVPCFTVMTADKDDPRFDSFYLHFNELRAFMALFITDMPSYWALGFELRDAHTLPVANEFYTKLYVFHYENGEKATTSGYKFGTNLSLFAGISHIKLFFESIKNEIKDDIPIFTPNDDQLFIWTYKKCNKWIAVANGSNFEKEYKFANITDCTILFSTHKNSVVSIKKENNTLVLSNIKSGECVFITAEYLNFS